MNVVLMFKKWSNKNRFNHKKIAGNYQSIFDLACTISPNFESNMKSLMEGKKSISAVMQDLNKNNIGAKLKQKMEDKDSLTMEVHEALVENPQFLERSVDLMEKFTNADSTNGEQKDILTETIAEVVEGSIDSGVKTASSWKRFRSKRNALKEGRVVDWAIDEAINKPIEEPAEEPIEQIVEELIEEPIEEVISEDITPENEITFEDLLLVDEDKKEALCNKIDAYIKTNVRGKGIALMILALRANSQLIAVHSNRHLCALIRSRFKQNIGHHSGVSDYLNPKNRPFSPKELEDTMKIFQL